jgi:hypothetical protein
LTLASTGGNAGGVGYSRRGMSCGWTICPAPGHSVVARKGGPGYGVRGQRSMRPTALSHRHRRIEPGGACHDPNTGFRGLAVGLFAACAAMVPARSASRPDGRNEPPYCRDGPGTGMVIVSRQVRAWAASLPRSKSTSTMPPNTTFAITGAVAAPNSGCASPTHSSKSRR